MDSGKYLFTNKPSSNFQLCFGFHERKTSPLSLTRRSQQKLWLLWGNWKVTNMLWLWNYQKFLFFLLVCLFFHYIIFSTFWVFCDAVQGPTFYFRFCCLLLGSKIKMFKWKTESKCFIIIIIIIIIIIVTIIIIIVIILIDFFILGKKSKIYEI